jgi:hypothetical protein
MSLIKKIFILFKNALLRYKQKQQRKKLLKRIREADMYIYD